MPSPEKSESRPVLLGLPFDALTEKQALDRIFEFATQGPGEEGCRSVVTVNVDFVVNTWSPFETAPRNPELAAILRRADLAVPDGMPLVWLSRLLGIFGIKIKIKLAMCHFMQDGLLYGILQRMSQKI